MLRALEVGKAPARGQVVRLHALQSVDERGPALEVDGPVGGHDGAHGVAARPEGVAHRAPWSRGVGAKVRVAVVADLEARGVTGYGDVEDGPLVGQRLDTVGRAVLGQLDGAVISVEVELVLADVDV